ncbi:MAG: porin [Gammaproteobacteria bacterium]
MKLRYTLLNSAIAGMLAMTASTGTMAADTNSLQRQIEELKAQNKIIMERLEATADMIESGDQGQGVAHDDTLDDSMREKTFRQHGSFGKTRVGGYGELHYNNTDSTNQIDMHRFVMFLGHEFNDKIRFWSELEVEHGKVDADGGEVSIEQAFVEFDLNDNNALRTGVILVPVGLINEIHEPTTFYGVERNNVEKYIIPTTWREGGASLTGHLWGSVSYDLAMHSGLEVSSGDNYAVRDGRNAVRKASAEDPAYTARIKWTGAAGLELGGAIQYQRDITQGTDTTAGEATLLEAHMVWQTGQAALRALYASWDLDGTGPAAVGADEQTGWYIEPSYKLTSKFGVFARQSNWDNQPNSGSNTENTQTDFGFNYWPHEDVVLKFDYQLRDNAGTDDDGFNLGVGYQF